MAHVRRLLVALLAALGMLSALSLSSATLAAPVAAPMMMSATAHLDGCDHGSMPNAPASHDYQNCATMCCAVLPSRSAIARHAMLPSPPTIARLDPLSGIDPGLDPPPPRMS
jgi:hypothetical protein